MPHTQDAISSVSFRNPVSETLLIPLFFKAKETRRQDRLLTDTTAVETLEKLNVDLSRFEGKKFSHIGTVLRARHFDREATRILAVWENPVLVHLGCGLDARFIRTDRGRGVQVELDLPEVMELRKNLLPPSERNPHIAASLFETSWMDALLDAYPGHRFAFVMEGVSMYLEESELGQFFHDLTDRFHGGELHLDVVSKWMARHSDMHDTIKECTARFSWGLDDPLELTRWEARLHHVKTAYYMNQELRRWGWAALMNLVPPLARGAKLLRYDII